MANAKNAWYIGTFEDKLKMLKTLRQKATGEEKRKIDETISTIESLIAPVNDREVVLKSKNLSSKFLFERDALKEYDFLLDLLLPLTTFSGEKKSINLKVPHLKKEELFGLVNEFFKSALDTELYEQFEYMYKNRLSLVSLNNTGDGYDSAEAIYLEYFNEVYIRLRRYHSVEDPANLAHEYGHGIQFLNNYNSNIYFGNQAFGEIISLFFELLMLTYLTNLSKFKNASIDQQVLKLYNYSLRSSQILIEYIALNELDLEKMTNGELRKTINKNILNMYSSFSIDEVKTIQDLLLLDLPDFAKYSISYLIAIEMYTVYMSDKDAGLKLLKDVMAIDLSLSKEEYYDKLVSLGINPSEHLDSYREHILTPVSRV